MSIIIGSLIDPEFSIRTKVTLLFAPDDSIKSEGQLGEFLKKHNSLQVPNLWENKTTY